MKRRVSGSRVRQREQYSSQWFSQARLIAVGLFVVLGIGLLTRLLLVQTDATPLIAFGQATLVVLPLAFLMLLSQILFFMISLGFMGAVLFDASGFPLAYFGIVLWTMGGVAAFLLTLSYLARFIAPPLNIDINRTSYLGFVLLIQEAASGLIQRSASEHPAPNIPQSFVHLNAGLVPDHQAYALYQGQSYSNAAGPGYTLLSNRNQIVSVFDLRPQMRQQLVKVATRDGIQIETKLRVEFSVAPPTDGRTTRLPYPFRRSAIRELVYGSTVYRDESEQTLHPYAQVLERAVVFLTYEISRRSLDDLLQINTAGAQPMDEVFSKVHAQLEQFAGKKGLQIRGIELAPLQLPQAVQDVRLAAWKKSWKEPIDNRGLGKSIGRISPEQARAQLQVVEDLLENLNTFADADSDMVIRDEIIEQVRDVITDAAAEGLLKALIPDPK